jgi:outer membrane protein TolC
MKKKFKIIILLSITWILPSCQTGELSINDFWNEVVREVSTDDQETVSFGKPDLKIEIVDVNYLPFTNQNLPENIKLVISNNPNVLAKIENIVVAKERVKEQSADKNIKASAQLTGGLAAEDRKTDPAVAASISVSKLLFDYGATDASIRSMRENVKISEIKTVIEAEKVAMEAVSAWIELYKNESIQKVYSDGVAMVKPLLGQIVNISTSGLVDKASLLEAKKKYATLTTESDQAKLRTMSAKTQFRKVFQLDNLSEVFEPQSLQLKIFALDDERLLENSPVIRTFDHTIYSKAEQLESLKSSQKPVFSLSGSVTAPAKDTLDDGVANFGLIVNHTFNDGGKRVARVSAVKSELTALIKQRQSSIEEIKTEFKQLTVALESSNREKELLEELFEISLEVRDAARSQLVSGRSTIDDVLQAEVGLSEIRIKLISINSQIVKTTFSLRALTGGLTSLFGWSIN